MLDCAVPESTPRTSMVLALPAGRVGAFVVEAGQEADGPRQMKAAGPPHASRDTSESDERNSPAVRAAPVEVSFMSADAICVHEAAPKLCTEQP